MNAYANFKTETLPGFMTAGVESGVADRRVSSHLTSWNYEAHTEAGNVRGVTKPELHIRRDIRIA
jgi:hypothetical protein